MKVAQISRVKLRKNNYNQQDRHSEWQPHHWHAVFCSAKSMQDPPSCRSYDGPDQYKIYSHI